MYLIKDYYNIPLMHAQCFSDSVSDPQWWMCLQQKLLLHFMIYRHYSLTGVIYNHVFLTTKNNNMSKQPGVLGPLSRSLWKLKFHNRSVSSVLWLSSVWLKMTSRWRHLSTNVCAFKPKQCLDAGTKWNDQLLCLNGIFFFTSNTFV